MSYKQPRPIIVAEGGTGALTLTNHGVLLGQGTNAIVATAVGTNGQVLTGVTASDPVWASPAASSISITGDSGGALVGAAFTFTGGVTGLTFSGAGSTETLTGTLAIANGGTNATSMAVTDGTVYFDGTRLVTTATGSSGQFLRSSGAGVAPAYATLPASSISITGDSGGALTGAAFTFTGGTTGLTFSGSGTTETLTGTLVVSNGGTGRATLTNHGVLVGAGTTAITQLAVGTTGQVLTGVTGSDPVFAAPAASSISITGDSGGALTGSAFTFTGGTTGLTFSGATTTETLTGTLVVANGGTGRATLTNHGVLVGASTTAITQLAVGTNGQVLIGSTGADPVFASLTSTGGSITYTTGAGTLNLDIANYVSTTYSPTLSFNNGTTGITYTTRSGIYTRIGSVVFVSVYIVLSNKGSSTGFAAVTLPVASNGTNIQNLVFSMQAGTPGATLVSWTQGSTALNLDTYSLVTGNYTALTDANFGNATGIYITGTYTV